MNAILLSLLVPVAFATTYETEIALERELFPYSATADSVVSMQDPADDMVVYDRNARNELPPVIADLTGMNIEPSDAGWLVTFTIAEPLPENPGLAVNFDVFIDADGDKSNNAKTGVFRSDSDLIFMILHGTATSWHSKWWKYDAPSDRWQEQPNDPEFTVDGSVFTLTIPYEALPRRAGIPIRGFSLTSDQGITAVDIVPGTDFPPALTNQPQPPTPPAATPPPSSSAASTGNNTNTIVLGALLFLLGVSITLWLTKGKRR